MVADTLACLDRARSPDGFDTPRVLDDGTHRLAFNAWEIARADIVRDHRRRRPPSLLASSDLTRAPREASNSAFHSVQKN